MPALACTGSYPGHILARVRNLDYILVEGHGLCVQKLVHKHVHTCRCCLYTMQCVGCLHCTLQARPVSASNGLANAHRNKLLVRWLKSDLLNENISRMLHMFLVSCSHASGCVSGATVVPPSCMQAMPALPALPQSMKHDAVCPRVLLLTT
jgi:hypothetical protein